MSYGKSTEWTYFHSLIQDLMECTFCKSSIITYHVTLCPKIISSRNCNLNLVAKSPGPFHIKLCACSIKTITNQMCPITKNYLVTTRKKLDYFDHQSIVVLPNTPQGLDCYIFIPEVVIL